MSEDQLRPNVRQTAVDAERHWWRQRLELLMNDWTLERQPIEEMFLSLRAIIAERSR